mgnify:FL=1
MVINDEFSIPELCLRAIEFYAHESCGKCTPCKQGSKTLKQALKRIVSKKGTRHDLDTALRIVNTVPGLTLCPVGEAYSIPVKTMLDKFRPDFEALINN